MSGASDEHREGPLAQHRVGACAAAAEPALLPGRPLCGSLTPPQGRRCSARPGPAWREGTDGTGQGGRGEAGALVELLGRAGGSPGVGVCVGVGIAVGLQRLQPRNRKRFRCSGVPCAGAKLCSRCRVSVAALQGTVLLAAGVRSCARPRSFKRFPRFRGIGKYLRLLRVKSDRHCLIRI